MDEAIDEIDITLGELLTCADKIQGFHWIFPDFPLDEFLNELSAPIENPVGDLTHLLISYWAGLNGKIGEEHFFVVPSLHGVGPGENGPETLWAISFTPVNELSHIQIKIDRKVKVEKLLTLEDGSVKIESMELGERDITLRELIVAVLDEISFHGTPANKKKRLDDLNQTLLDIDSGKEKLVSWDDFEKELWPKPDLPIA